MTNCRCCLQSPAPQPSWASAAQRHIDSQRRASCRCAGSAAVSTSSPPSFESWSHHERIGLSRGGTHCRQLVVGSWPVARYRLDFVRPGTAAGQISLVSVVVGKVHTWLRDSPDGTRVAGGSHCGNTRWSTTYGQSGPPMAPMNVLVVHSKLDNRPCKWSGNKNGR